MNYLIRDIAKLVQKSTCGQTHPFEPKKEEKPEVHHCNQMTDDKNHRKTYGN